MLRSDGFFGKFLTRILNLLIANGLFLLCSLPVFTIGGALSALYTVIFRLRDGEEGIVKPFFQDFRGSFCRALIDTLVMAGIGAGIWAAFSLCRRAGLTASIGGKTVFGLAGFLVLTTLLWLYPLISRFDAPYLKTLWNAFILSICHFPVTLVMILERIALIAIFLVLPKQLLMTYACFLVFFSASVTAWCDSCLLKWVFLKYQTIPVDKSAGDMV